MIDWERLEAEIAGDDIAARVVAAARRNRLRRRLVTLAIAAAVAAGAILLAVQLVPDDEHASAADKNATVPVAVQGKSSRADIYAAALSGGARTRPLRNLVFVRDHICGDIPHEPGTACSGAAIPDGVQDAVTSVLGPEVRFLTTPPAPVELGDPTVVTFGTLRVRGSTAHLGMETQCGPLCGEGETLLLELHGGHWAVVGATGPRWIS